MKFSRLALTIAALAATPAVAAPSTPAVQKPVAAPSNTVASTSVDHGNAIGAESDVVNVLALAATAGAVVGLLALTGGEESDTPVSN